MGELLYHIELLWACGAVAQVVADTCIARQSQFNEVPDIMRMLQVAGELRIEIDSSWSTSLSTHLPAPLPSPPLEFRGRIRD